MSDGAVHSRLAELGLRVPAAEMDAFAALVADMQEAARVARRELPYRCEPACVFALSPAPTSARQLGLVDRA